MLSVWLQQKQKLEEAIKNIIKQQLKCNAGMTLAWQI